MTDPAYVVVTTTTDSAEEAASLASSAVTARLAACGQVSQIRSAYWWDGAVQQADEWRIDFKTPAGRRDDLTAHIVDEHSYDTPEVIVTPIFGGSADYLAWLDAETRPR